MSKHDSPAETSMPLDIDVPAEAPRSAHKSYRRKYRKIMVRFEENMRESNDLFKDEQRMLDLSRRLAEQTDLLLQLLEDANKCPQIPASLRYDLSTSPTVRMPSAAKADTKADTARRSLQDARLKVRRREWTATRYREVVEFINEDPIFLPKKSYMSLLKAFHATRSKPPEWSADPGNIGLSGALTAKEEEQYITGMTTYLDGKSNTMRPHAAGGMASERAVEREKEMQLRNPVSVYNWLRSHQPGVFLQDHDGHGDKSGKPVTSRSSKRSLGNGTALRQEHDVYEDDNNMDGSSLSKLKRKRNDDPGYRPKGGASRPLKRKKEDSSTSSKRMKKGFLSNV